MSTRTSFSLLCAVLLGCSRGELRQARTQSQDSANFRTPAPDTTDTASHYCLRGPSALRISEDSIGPFDLSARLRDLQALCPVARHTVSYGQESANPALLLPFDGLTVLAVQFKDSLVLDEPADAWRIRGANASLLGQVLLSAPWAAFRAAFGPGIVSAQNASTDVHEVHVMFCAHPRMFFDVDASPDSVAVDDTVGQWNHNLSRIPGGTKVKEVGILPRPDPTWYC